MKTAIQTVANICVGLLVILTVAACDGFGSGDGTKSPAPVESGWQTAALLKTNETDEASTPQIAFDRSGNALAVWYQSDGTHLNILANRYAAGGGWGTASHISAAGGDALFPQIAFDPNGNALAVWEQPAGPYPSIWSSRYSVGGGWDTPVLVEANDAGTAVVPHIAFDAQGNALAVWYQSDGARFNVWSNRYTPGMGWGSARLIGTDDPGNWVIYDSEPQIVMDPNGNALVLWQQIDIGTNGIGVTTSNIWTNRYTAGTGWGMAEQLETSAADEPNIAVDANGNAQAVWTQGDGTTTYIWSSRYTAGSGWGTARQVSGGKAKSAQIAFDGHGNALAAWEQSDGAHTHIWSSRYAAGSDWDTPAQIETGTAGSAAEPHIACDESGNAMAVWQQSDGTRNNIWANRYVAGKGWDTAQLIETDNAGDATVAHIAIDGRGNALALWQESDGAHTHIWWNWFTRPPAS